MNITSLLFDRDMRGIAVHICELRSYCPSPRVVAEAVRTADRLGVKIKGDLNYAELTELNELRGGTRSLRGV
jgi:hypothetical protein